MNLSTAIGWLRGPYKGARRATARIQPWTGRAGCAAAQPAQPAQPGFLPCPVVPRCGQFAHLASGAAVG